MRSFLKPWLISLLLVTLLLVSFFTAGCEAKKHKRIRRPPVMGMRPALFHWGFSVNAPVLFSGKVVRRSLDSVEASTDVMVRQEVLTADEEEGGDAYIQDETHLQRRDPLRSQHIKGNALISVKQASEKEDAENDGLKDAITPPKKEDKGLVKDEKTPKRHRKKTELKDVDSEKEDKEDQKVESKKETNDVESKKDDVVDEASNKQKDGKKDGKKTAKGESKPIVKDAVKDDDSDESPTVIAVKDDKKTATDSKVVKPHRKTSKNVDSAENEAKPSPSSEKKKSHRKKHVEKAAGTLKAATVNDTSATGSTHRNHRNGRVTAAGNGTFVNSVGVNNTVGGNSTAPESEETKAAFNVLGSVIFMVVGFVFLFVGFLIFKPAIFVSGFFLFVLAAIAVMNLVQNGGTSISTGAFFGICGVAGLIGGFIFLCIWKLGLFALGAILGFVLSAVILSFVSGSISQGAGRVVFIVGMCLGFAVLVFFFEKSLYIVATAIPGAYAVVLGIDGFAKVGFRDATMTFLGKGTFETSPKLFAMIGGFFVAAGVGIGVQTYLFYRRKRRGGYVEAKQDEGKGEMEKVSLLESGDKQYPQKAP